MAAFPRLGGLGRREGDGRQELLLGGLDTVDLVFIVGQLPDQVEDGDDVWWAVS